MNEEFFSIIGEIIKYGGLTFAAPVVMSIYTTTDELFIGIMQTNFFIIICLGIAISFIGNIFIEDFLNFLSDAPENVLIIDMAISYLRITLCSVPFLIIIYITGAFMRCIGKPAHVIYLMSATVFINVVLDAIFIIIFDWLSGIMAALEDEWRNIVIGLSPIFVQMPLMWFLPKILPIEYVSLSYSLKDVAEALIAFVLIKSFLKTNKISFRKIFS